jgi:hypothetical protein
MIGDSEGLPVGKIREIANSYYIPKASEMEENQLRWELLKKVTIPFSNSKLEDFFSRSKSTRSFEDHVTVRKAIDAGIVKLKKNNGKTQYAIMNEERPLEADKWLVKIEMKDMTEKETKLLNYLKSNTDIFNIIRDRLKNVSEEDSNKPD